jgi:tetrahydromethanopterin S-methyltransferase subunit B
MCDVAGYSTTPLAKKLGIVDGTTVVLVDKPSDLPVELPSTVVLRHQIRGSADVVVVFVERLSRLDRRFEGLARAVYPSGGLWIAWPKRSAGIPTDVSDHAVRKMAVEHGLVDNKICAIDDVWTALRLVWRRQNRGDPAHSPLGA